LSVSINRFPLSCALLLSLPASQVPVESVC